MRLRLRLLPQNDRTVIPINYNLIVSQFVYELVQPDVPFSFELGAQLPSVGVPYYTFSNLYIPNVQQQDEELWFDKVHVDLTISLLIDRRGELEILRRIASGPALVFPNAHDSDSSLSVDIIEVLHEVRSFGRRARFRMCSPLASPLHQDEFAQDMDQSYIHYNDPEFSEALRATLIAKYVRWKGRVPRDTDFYFVLDQRYVQRRRGRISKLVTLMDGAREERKIKAIVAPFECEGNPELIWLGYVAGFGERNIFGFGFSDVVNAPAKPARIIQLPAGALLEEESSWPSVNEGGIQYRSEINDEGGLANVLRR